MTAKEEEELPQMLQDFATVLRAKGINPANDLLDMLGGVADHYAQTLSQQHERDIAVLHGDIAYAIGYCSGVGHPCAYLERHHPDLGKQQQQSNGEKQ